jgi:glycosyltransferase involved in cell wall biosynthesis
MILIFGPLPEESLNTGVAQRAFGIDSLFENQYRIYVRFTKDPTHYCYQNQFGPDSRIMKLILNPESIEHRRIIFEYMESAHLIYSHSIFGLEHVTEFLSNPHIHRKLVTDMHGVVPEEFELQGNLAEAERFGRLEETVVSLSALLIFVSDRMEVHYRSKYPRLNFRSVVLPIFPSDFTLSRPVSQTDIPCIIYAGGIEKWQNFEKMLDAIERAPVNLKFKFFSFSKSEMREQLVKRGLKERVEVATLFTAQEMKEELRRAQYGFVLRDLSIVNQVSCPTKLIDYLYAGVIPIVLSSEIGDFNQYGYKFITLKEFMSGELPSDSKRLEMVARNHEVVQALHKNINNSFQEVLGLISISGLDANEWFRRIMLRNSALLSFEKKLATTEIAKDTEIVQLKESLKRAETTISELKSRIEYRARRYAGDIKRKAFSFFQN